MTRYPSTVLLLLFFLSALRVNGLEDDDIQSGGQVYQNSAIVERTPAPSVTTTNLDEETTNTPRTNGEENYWQVAATNAPTTAQVYAFPPPTTTEDEPQPSSSTTTSTINTSPTSTLLEENNEFLGIPGTQQTINGYDTALGDDPICWMGAAATNSNVTSAAERAKRTVFPNPLVEDFVLMGETQILQSCPTGNLVTVEQPTEGISGERLRTEQWYDYSLHVEIDLDTLEGDYIVTDNGTATIALQVVVCGLGLSGFCSPFVHEQANLRESIEKANSGVELIQLEKVARGDLHGGSHVHSPWVYLDMKPQQRTLSANASIPLIVNHPGEYFVIGTVQLYTGVNGSVAYRHDISNAMDPGAGRYITYQAPAVIQEVSDEVLYISYAAIAVAGSVIMFLIFQTFRHKEEQVLQLSQADFLIVFLICALAATIFTFLLQPKSDIYCRMSYPLILIPIQLMYAITVGRLWRIHAVISPLLLEHLTKGEPGLTQRFVEAITFISFKLNNLFVAKQNMRRSSTASSVKQQISQFQLALVVLMFTLPQFVLQVIAAIAQPQERQILFNEDESIGRPTCSAGVDAAHNLLTYSLALLVLLVIILLFMAHSSRKLPSLFNETHVIYDSTFLSFVLMILGGAVIALTDAPGTSPDVEYLVVLVMVLSITLNSAVRILLPKLRMVWKGDVVVVSKLVTDHHRRAREKQAEKGSLMSGVTGFDPSSRAGQGSFSTGGDYAFDQQNKLLHTIHSNSNETGLMGSKSSLEESGRCRNTAEERAVSDAEVGIPKINSDFVDECEEAAIAPSKEPQKGASSTELDVESGASFDSAPDEKQALPTHKDAPDAEVAQKDNHPAECCSTDGEVDLESTGAAMETAALTEGNEQIEERSRRSSKEQRTNGFLKHAMPKVLSKQWSSWKHPGKSLKAHDVGDDEKPKSVQEPKSKPKPKRRLAQRMVVTEEETPARRLVLKMLDLQDQLEEVNNKIMSGAAVTQDDWGEITKLTSKLDRTFKDEVEFEWDIQKRYEETLNERLPADMSCALSVDSGNGHKTSPSRPLPQKKSALRKTMSSSAAQAFNNAAGKRNMSAHSSPDLMDASGAQLSDCSFH